MVNSHHLGAKGSQLLGTVTARPSRVPLFALQYLFVFFQCEICTHSGALGVSLISARCIRVAIVERAISYIDMPLIGSHSYEDGCVHVFTRSMKTQLFNKE